MLSCYNKLMLECNACDQGVFIMRKYGPSIHSVKANNKLHFSLGLRHAGILLSLSTLGGIVKYRYTKHNSLMYGAVQNK